jgi:serine/threonine protein kinase
MADVFYAAAPAGGPVAVKVFRGNGGGSAACYREYVLARAVAADCTAPALDHGTSAAGPYLVMAYLPGYRCGITLADRPTPAEWLWRFGAALARVLTSLHARGVVHCDVKPSNLLVRDDDVRVIDFGISRYVGERPEDDGTVQCSPGWAAPEQLRTAPLTPAVDVFAWGCVLAYLAGGVHPFAGGGQQEWFLRVQSAEPDLPDLPADLEDVIRWSLARHPRDRPSAAELATICGTRGDGQPAPPVKDRLTSLSTVPTVDQQTGRSDARHHGRRCDQRCEPGPVEPAHLPGPGPAGVPRQDRRDRRRRH